jgi:hypothetical protein
MALNAAASTEYDHRAVLIFMNISTKFVSNSTDMTITAGLQAAVGICQKGHKKPEHYGVWFKPPNAREHQPDKRDPAR